MLGWASGWRFRRLVAIWQLLLDGKAGRVSGVEVMSGGAHPLLALSTRRAALVVRPLPSPHLLFSFKPNGWGEGVPPTIAWRGPPHTHPAAAALDLYSSPEGG